MLLKTKWREGKRRKLSSIKLHEWRLLHRFCNYDDNVLKKNWQWWKYMYGVSNTTMNVLLFFSFQRRDYSPSARKKMGVTFG
jgi:hypothetical protein